MDALAIQREAPRIQFPNALYHVINRGNYRKDVFMLDSTRRAFERCLFEAAEQAGWLIHA
jgi:REP element-mobilizing transposase RayT